MRKSLFDFCEVDKKGTNLVDAFTSALKDVEKMSLDEKVDTINKLRAAIHDISPFNTEPVDCVKWVKVSGVESNDYNPNSVAPPEMELLRTSIMHDGYTQPIVTWPRDGVHEVVDGFHRNRVARECSDVGERVHGYLPVVEIRGTQTDKNDRIASTIRHNRARGKHKVESMSDIVIELKNRNWKDSRIAKELGMDEDEILRLCQITGLEGLFKDGEFSKSWDVGSPEDEYQNLTDNIEDEENLCRTVNTSDPERIFHTFDKWECYKYGFYDTTKEGMSKKECENAYAEFLSDLNLFEKVLKKVVAEWKHSCEHYLTNRAMNRIAWLGQAAIAYHSGIPSKFCGGFNLLTEEQQDSANKIALKYLNKWLVNNGLEEVEMEEALSLGRQISIY